MRRYTLILLQYNNCHYASMPVIENENKYEIKPANILVVGWSCCQQNEISEKVS